MRAIVTGAGGFAGTWLCRHLLACGDEVIGWVRRPPTAPVPGVRYRIQDVTDAAGCAAAIAADAPEALYHLAAIAHLGDANADPERARAVNVGGTRNVMAPLPPGTPALLSSSCHVYGPPRRLPVDASHPLAPSGVYAESKLAAESAARAAHPAVAITRAFHHTGPGHDPRFAFPDWARQIAARRRSGDRSPLVVGDVDLRRDYSDVRDVAAGYRILLTRGAPGQIYDLCSGRAPSLRSLLGAMMGDDPLPVQVDPARLRPGSPREVRGDPSRVMALGWRPSRDLRETVREMVLIALGREG